MNISTMVVSSTSVVIRRVTGSLNIVSEGYWQANKIEHRKIYVEA
jgi:hypothetical protein